MKIDTLVVILNNIKTFVAMITIEPELTAEERKRNRQALAKMLLERKRENVRQMREEYENSPDLQQVVENLKKRLQAKNHE